MLIIILKLLIGNCQKNKKFTFNNMRKDNIINLMEFVSFRFKEFENHDKIESKYWNELP